MAHLRITILQKLFFHPNMPPIITFALHERNIFIAYFEDFLYLRDQMQIFTSKFYLMSFE